MSSDELRPFGDLFAVPLRNGLTRPKAVRGAGTKMVNMGELFAHPRIENAPMDRVPLDGVDRERSLLCAGDLLFARQSLVLEGAGKCSIFVSDVEPVTFESHVIRARLNRDVADPDFYFYYFTSPRGRASVRSIVEQVAAAGIRGRDLAKLPVPVPPLARQREVARVLRTLDDKIELNRSMNRTLESITRTIFKSWFIDFDPVRRKMEGGEVAPDLAALFQPSPTVDEHGLVPQGWFLGTLGDVAVQLRVQARPDDLPSGTPCFGLEHLPRRSIALADWGVADHVASAKTRFSEGDLLFGKLRPYFHKVGLAPVDGVCSTDIVVVRPRHPNLGAFVLGHLSSDEFVEYAAAGASGTRMPRTSWKDMAAYPVVLPPNQALRAYQATVNPLLRRIQNSILESRALVAVREQLLPELLAGRLSNEGA